MKVSTDTKLMLSPDFEIRLDYQRNFYGWREDRAARSWINRELVPLTPEKVQLLLKFQHGANPADVAEELTESGEFTTDEIMAFVEELESFGILTTQGDMPSRPDERFLPLDFDPGFAEIFRQVKDVTLTSVAKQYSLYNACRYVVEAKVPGDWAECGVWRGGSSMLAALTLKKLGDTSRRLHLFDTYEGMPDSTDKDVFFDGASTIPKGALAAGLEEVRGNMSRTGYPEDRLIYVKGMVEDTLPAKAPEKLALLRLDTDFHDSTYHAMVHLYPRLVPGGVLLLDDYGAMRGAQEAVHTYLAETNQRPLIHRIERLGIAVKT